MASVSARSALFSPLRSVRGRDSGSATCALQTRWAGPHAESRLGHPRDRWPRVCESVSAAQRGRRALSLLRSSDSPRTGPRAAPSASGGWFFRAPCVRSSREGELAAEGPTGSTLRLQAPWRRLRLPQSPCGESPRALPGPGWISRTVSRESCLRSQTRGRMGPTSCDPLV